MAYWIQLKFGIGGAPPRGNSHVMCFCSESVELQMCENCAFFTPVKYTLVCRAPQVSWATRHTTVCLDIYRSLSYSQIQKITVKIQCMHRGVTVGPFPSA